MPGPRAGAADTKGQTLRRGKLESSAVIKRIVRQRGKPGIPHQVRIKRRVDGHRRAPLIARSGAVRADNAVVVDADGDGLRVAKSACGRMAAGAGVVVVQPGNRVEPEQASNVG